MTKVTIDRALIEQAIESMRLCVKESGFPETMQEEIDAMEKALAEPAVKPTCKQPLQVHKQTGWVAHKNQYAMPVLFNPYTGEPRDVRDVQSDPQGVLIVPPGKVEMIAASAPPPAEPAVEPSTDDSSVLSACQKLAQAFKTSPPPAEPAPVPLLSDDEIKTEAAKHQLSDTEHRHWYGDDYTVSITNIKGAVDFARAIERAVRQKAGL